MITFKNNNNLLKCSLIETCKNLTNIYKILVDNKINISELISIVSSNFHNILKKDLLKDILNDDEKVIIQTYSLVKNYVDLNTFIDIFYYTTSDYYYRLYLMYNYINNTFNNIITIKRLNYILWLNDYQLYKSNKYDKFVIDYDKEHFIQNYFDHLKKEKFKTFYEYVIFNIIKTEFNNL